MGQTRRRYSFFSAYGLLNSQVFEQNFCSKAQIEISIIGAWRVDMNVQTSLSILVKS